MAELGTGGGQGDLDQQYELDLDDASVVNQIMSFCASELQDQPELSSAVLQMLTLASENQKKKLSLDSSHVTKIYSSLPQHLQSEAWPKLPLETLVPLLAKHTSNANQDSIPGPQEEPNPFPEQIKFPYSRHASYHELCLLIDAFKPKNIYPCTVDEKNWTIMHSMGYLFGHLYDGAPKFSHDEEMLEKQREDNECNPRSHFNNDPSSKSEPDAQTCPKKLHPSSKNRSKRRHGASDPKYPPNPDAVGVRRAVRKYAYDAALGHGGSWFDVELVSVRGHQEEEEEL